MIWIKWTILVMSLRTQGVVTCIKQYPPENTGRRCRRGSRTRVKAVQSIAYPPPTQWLDSALPREPPVLATVTPYQLQPLSCLSPSLDSLNSTNSCMPPYPPPCDRAILPPSAERPLKT